MAAKAYTRLGDCGVTRLMTGCCVAKDQPRVDTYGDVDELNSFVGLARSKNKNKKIEIILNLVQDKLFQLCSDIAMPVGEKITVKIKRVSDDDVREIEKFTDDINETLPEIRNFAIFGNSELAALFNTCRAVSRRAERKIVTLAKSEPVNHAALKFMNRLSSLFWVLARYALQIEKKKEILWKQN